MKKMVWMWAVMAAVLAGSGAAPAMAQQDAVLLVVPSRYSVMQVAFDVARRYPTVLVSYQGTMEEPVLHVWNGYEWMPLSLADYQSGAFLQAYPGRTVFLGDDTLLPASLRSINAWCEKVVQLPDLQTPQLVNGIGQTLPFTPSDWRWFAGRYNLTLTNLRAEEAEKAREESWYSGKDPVQDPAPGFFRYFTRSRRGSRRSAEAPMEPVQVQEGDVVEMPAP
ncbi:MAG: hypothetical protein GX548_00835 [Lentisphaerae bacterium]|nr:hypothetical protein [Lentisphaerota bacterium]